MALFINTNVSSLRGQYNLTQSHNSLNTSYRRLGSGLRINTAADDAANLHISDNLTSQINGFDQGNRNANDGLALAQTIDGALDETASMLQKIRTLAVQSANGTYSKADRDAMQTEVNQICAEIDRLARQTTYAGARILDGVESADANKAGRGENLLQKDGTIDFQVGSNSMDLVSLNLRDGFTLFGINNGAGGLEVTDADDDIDASTNEDFTGLVKIGDNSLRWSVSSMDNAQVTLKNIDAFINMVDSHRTELGALQNRMESNIRNISGVSNNHSDSRSRIRDTDFASETASLTQNSILEQASQSILTQANQHPSIAVTLLK